VEIRIRADRDVPSGMIFIPFCYVEAAANLLTNPALDPFGKTPEFKFCAARITRVEGRRLARSSWSGLNVNRRAGPASIA